MHRFPWFGTQGERSQQTDGSANEEISRRFRLEVLEDKATLNYPNLAAASHKTVQALVKKFDQWVADVGGDPMAQYQLNPRLAGCLAIDLESLRSLVQLSEESIPPLRAATDLEEKQVSACFFQGTWLAHIIQIVTTRRNVTTSRSWPQNENGVSNESAS